MKSNYFDPVTAYPHRPGCIGRSAYLVRGLCFFVGAFVAGCTMDAANHFPHGFGLLPVLAGVSMLALMFVGLFVFILIPRVRDIGLPHAWAWSLLFFVHPVSFAFLLALLLIPANAFAKRHYSF